MADVPPRPGCNNNKKYNRGYNANYPGGYNPNHPRGYNPNYPRGYNHNPFYNGVYNSNYHGRALQKSEPVETMFMKFAEKWYKERFSNVHNFVLAVNSISSMMNATFIAMKSTFWAIVSVSENFQKLGKAFGYICQAVKLYVWFRWMYVKLMKLLGCEVPLSNEEETINTQNVDSIRTTFKQLIEEIPYGLLGFVSAVVAGPFFISKMFFQTYEESCATLKKWEHPGFRATVVKNFQATAPTEMSLKVNDRIVVAPKHVQNEMNVDISKMVFALGNGRSGLVPLNNLKFQSYDQVPV